MQKWKGLGNIRGVGGTVGRSERKADQGHEFLRDGPAGAWTSWTPRQPRLHHGCEATGHPAPGKTRPKPPICHLRITRTQAETETCVLREEKRGVGWLLCKTRRPPPIRGARKTTSRFISKEITSSFREVAAEWWAQSQRPGQWTGEEVETEYQCSFHNTCYLK